LNAAVDVVRKKEIDIIDKLVNANVANFTVLMDQAPCMLLQMWIHIWSLQL
jgi:hypothetical protein